VDAHVSTAAAIDQIYVWQADTQQRTLSFFMRMACSNNTQAAMTPRPGAVAGVAIAAAVVSVAVPFIIARMTPAGKRIASTGRTLSAPPSLVFAVVWGVLYALAGVGLTGRPCKNQI
jgi:hypothetical protein